MLLEPLLQHASNQPDALAIRDDRGSVSFAQLATIAIGLSQVIARATSRDRVGILLPASSSFAACTYGAMLAGKSVVPINFLLSPQQIAHMILDSGIDTILTAPPLIEKFAPMAAQLPAKFVDLSQLPGSTQSIDLGGVQPPRVDENAVAVMLYTSGTSGLPKGVPLTHRNLQTCVDACVRHVFRGSNHHFLGLVPLFHSTGFTGAMLAPIHIGAPVTYIGRFSPVATVKMIREEKCDIVLAVPSMYAALMHLKSAGPEDFAHAYALICGGEPLSGALRDAFEQRFGKPLLQGYGLSETCGPIAVNAPHARRDGSVGQLVPCGQVRIADEFNQPLPPMQTGEIQLGGPSIMHGYHNLPDATRDVMTGDGFFRTGDLGHIDEEGYLYITGRAKDMIIISGEKLAPREIEEMLLRHEQIADAAVVGKKDDSRGEVPVAFVVPREGMTLDVASVKDFLKQFELPGWKLPKEIIVTDALPRSPTGKVLKRELVAKLAT